MSLSQNDMGRDFEYGIVIAMSNIMGYDGNEMEDTNEYDSAGDAMVHLGYMILRMFNDGEDILEIKYEEVK